MKMLASLIPLPSSLLQIVRPTHNERLISFIFLPSVREHFSSPIVNPITEGFIPPPAIGWGLRGLGEDLRQHCGMKLAALY